MGTIVNSKITDRQQNENDVWSTSRAIIIGYVLLFCLFLYKFSFYFGGDGLSGNYSFLILPLGIFLISKKVKIPAAYLSFYILIYIFILITSTVIHINDIDLIGRRVISFILFILVFSYAFIEIDNKMVLAFKIALILVSVVVCFSTMYKYIELGGAALGYAAKDAVGGQRFGFVYVMSFWILFFIKPATPQLNMIKFFFLGVIAIGVLLTFSRSGLVAMILTTFFYGLGKFTQEWKRNKIKGVANWIWGAIALIGSVVIIGLIFPQIFEFFDDRLFSFFMKGGVEKMDLGNEDGSEGFRVFLFKKILEYVSNFPLTGSGYLGVWILFDDHSGSAHNQYTDILFRTGLIGFLIYILILFKIAFRLYKIERGLFWGLFGVFIYGFFHETFKESHGAFILTFLIGILNSSDRKFLNYSENAKI